jgi:hypothetical protein
MRSIIVAFVAIAMAASPSLAQRGIWVCPDVNCVAERVNVVSGQPTTLYIFVTGNSFFGVGVRYAEFRVDGLPLEWTASATPNGMAVQAVGNPFAEGAKIWFPTNMPGALVRLYSVTLVANGQLGRVTLNVRGHSSPSDPNRSCPVTLTYVPEYDSGCSNGGYLTVNETTAIDAATWAGTKGLYR